MNFKKRLPVNMENYLLYLSRQWNYYDISDCVTNGKSYNTKRIILIISMRYLKSKMLLIEPTFDILPPPLIFCDKTFSVFTKFS